ncbi:MAG TPA: lasso RiPP family leader peptide-containing protein [Gemmatimonadaceae bacterium]|nr:lasso RiPP family leader peptide-containing protein [Gemmatimonadaceae bacterium]
MYESPKLEVFGTFRELTQGGNEPFPGDGSPFHRYGGDQPT